MEKHNPSLTANGKISILIVEDSITQAQKLQYFLEEENFQVDWVEDGLKALEYLQKKIPTIIISDVLMPEIDGFEFCSLIKKDTRYKHIPVILLTTLTEPQDVIKGLECGADNFITKPYDKDYLFSRLSYILTNQKLRQISGEKSTELGLEIFFSGNKYFITSEKMQIIDLLLATYEAVAQKNIELQRVNKELKEAHENIRVLRGLIPICSKCKKVRNDDGFWEQVEDYIGEHSDADFSHSICPDCLKELYPGLVLNTPKKEKK